MGTIIDSQSCVFVCCFDIEGRLQCDAVASQPGYGILVCRDSAPSLQGLQGPGDVCHQGFPSAKALEARVAQILPRRARRKSLHILLSR